MRFTSPWLLFLALVPLALLALRHWLRRPFWGYTGEAAWRAPIDPRSWRTLPTVLTVLAGAALAVALADPHVRRTVVDPQKQGRAIVIVLDLSYSMQDKVGPYTVRRQANGAAAPDTRPTRLDVIKPALKDFISLRRNDRIGFVVFSESAYVISPLTTDYAYLSRYVDMIDVNTLSGEGYTAIGEGVAAATQLLTLEGVKDGQKGIVLVFTDGENNVGRDPVQAVRVMQDAGHRGYMIGVDLPAYVTQSEPVRRLVAAFDASGGRYYDVKSDDGLEDAYRDVSELLADPLRLRKRTEDVPVYAAAVAVCLVLLTMALILRTLPPFTRLS